MTSGKRVSLLVDVAPKPKMHVYAPGQEGYIAITLTLDADPAFTAGKATYPAGEKLFMQILNETQLVYAKPFRIAQDGVTLAQPEMRRRLLWRAPDDQGTVRYRACDDRSATCPPRPGAWTVKLAVPAFSLAFVIKDWRYPLFLLRPRSWASCTVSAPIT